MLACQEEMLMHAFDRREQALLTRLRTAEDHARTMQRENDSLKVRNLQLTTQLAQKALDDAKTRTQPHELSHLEEVAALLEETMLKTQGAFIRHLERTANTLRVYTWRGSSPSPVDSTPSPSPSSLKWGAPESPPSSPGPERLTGQKRPREHANGEPYQHTTPELMAMAN